MKEILQVRDQEENDIVLQISIYDTIRNKTVLYTIYFIFIFLLFLLLIHVTIYIIKRYKLKMITILIKMMTIINWLILIIYLHLLLNMLGYIFY